MPRLVVLFLIFLTAISPVFTGSGKEHFHIRDKCLTFEEDKKQEFLQSISGQLQDGRPIGLPVVYKSPQGNFRIHYDTAGKHAVDDIDLDANGVPDFVDSTAHYFEEVYAEYMNMGFESPIPDEGGGGGDEYDIYLMEIGKSKVHESSVYYGVTVPSLTYKVEGRNFVLNKSYIIIDNNYSPYDTTYTTIINNQGMPDTVSYPTYYSTGYDGLKVTAAHEFHHSVQYIYGLPDFPLPQASSVHEMVSTYFEHRLYPEVKDYYQYIQVLFRFIYRNDFAFGNPETSNGYQWSIFFQYANHHYGDSLMLRMWELVGNDILEYTALDSALKERGSSLKNEMCKFTDWLYYTGSRTLEAPPGEHFETADEFPKLRFANEGQNDTYNGEKLRVMDEIMTFGIKPYRFFFPGDGRFSEDTVSVVLLNTDIEALKDVRIKPGGFLLEIDSIPGQDSEPLEKTDFYITLLKNPELICENIKIDPGVSADNISYAYPNPYIPGMHSELFVPAPENGKLYKSARFFLFNKQMVGLHSGEYQILPHEGNQVLMISNLPENIESGIYIFAVEYDGQRTLGKFSIIRK